MYPLALLPIAMLYVDRHLGRREAWLGAAIGAGTAAAVVLPFVVIAPEGVRYFVHWHLDRGLQLETVRAPRSGCSMRWAATRRSPSAAVRGTTSALPWTLWPRCRRSRSRPPSSA